MDEKTSPRVLFWKNSCERSNDRTETQKAKVDFEQVFSPKKKNFGDKTTKTFFRGLFEQKKYENGKTHNFHEFELCLCDQP